MDAIVGKGVTISVAAGGGDRFFHGVVSRFAQSGTVGRHATYRADIVPWLWFVTRTSDCRIFQKKSGPDIVKQLFGEYGFTDFRFKLSASYEPREYCVQYRETDYNFVARLLEEEGSSTSSRTRTGSTPWWWRTTRAPTTLVRCSTTFASFTSKRVSTRTTW